MLAAARCGYMRLVPENVVHQMLLPPSKCGRESVDPGHMPSCPATLHFQHMRHRVRSAQRSAGSRRHRLASRHARRWQKTPRIPHAAKARQDEHRCHSPGTSPASQCGHDRALHHVAQHGGRACPSRRRRNGAVGRPEQVARVLGDDARPRCAMARSTCLAFGPGIAAPPGASSPAHSPPSLRGVVEPPPCAAGTCVDAL